jgi:hypothetical protein
MDGNDHISGGEEEEEDEEKERGLTGSTTLTSSPRFNRLQNRGEKRNTVGDIDGRGGDGNRRSESLWNPLRPFLANLGHGDQAADRGQFELGSSDDVEDGDFVAAVRSSGVIGGSSREARGDYGPKVDMQLQDVRMHLKVDWDDDGTAPHALEIDERRPQDVNLTEYGPLLTDGAFGGTAFSKDEADSRKRKETVRLKQQRHFMEGATGRFKSWSRLSNQFLRKHKRDGGQDLNGDGELDAYEHYWRTIKTLQPMERAVWLLAQGRSKFPSVYITSSHSFPCDLQQPRSGHPI